ncbi:aspartate aminotransferase family protein [Thalassobaculum fulvum]|uniref:Aspartate aminotransferase family protein n=1 Tax=Thalassobaculum fulvum TaxID=1633335 RepID=A0A918XVE3_9PROT|nr:aspartate aminotransferase family protein [Thalassobaculum fulvum]GHD58554.1 aspartate aminotransferase family protein [Thalassobaculum fulvum]
MTNKLNVLSDSALMAADTAHHLHPFTDYKALAAEGSRVIVRAEGCTLWDSQGNAILDGMAGLWCVNIGYGREELADVAARQMRELPYYNTFFKTTTRPATELATRLAELTPPGLEHVFFANSGSEANDTIVRMVRRYWQLHGQPERNVIISREYAYHGSTLVGASLGGMSAMHSQTGLPLPGFEHIRPPYYLRDGGNMTPQEFGVAAAQALEERILALGPERVAAFIAEPIQGAGGVIVPPDSYFPEIQRICREYGILLIADEVICGFGRTGNWFGSETFGIEPDLMTLAKGLSSGYLPISAVMVGDRVARTLIDEGGEFFHGFTYSGHPVACAVALENLRIMQDEGLVERVRDDIGPYFQDRLRELADHPLVGEVRGVGLIAGVELVRDKDGPVFFQPEGRVGTICRDHCFRNNVIMRAVRDGMVISPPLVISHAEVDRLVETARRCFDLTQADIGL